MNLEVGHQVTLLEQGHKVMVPRHHLLMVSSHMTVRRAGSSKGIRGCAKGS